MMWPESSRLHSTLDVRPTCDCLSLNLKCSYCIAAVRQRLYGTSFCISPFQIPLTPNIDRKNNPVQSPSSSQINLNMMNTNSIDNMNSSECTPSKQTSISQTFAPTQIKLTNHPITKEISLDCEMVETTFKKKRTSALARVSIVNSSCKPILDTYVMPEHPITDYRFKYSGIRAENLRNAPPFLEVQKFVLELTANRIIVGHDIAQDLVVLGMTSHPIELIRDTSSCYMSYFGPNQRPSLKRLAKQILGRVIQKGQHDSMVDAKVTMDLYDRWKRLGRSIEEARPVGLKHWRKSRNPNQNRGTDNRNDLDLKKS